MINEEIINALTSVYVMKKLDDRSFSLTDQINNNSRSLMLSNDFNNHLMIVQNDYYIKLLINLYSDLDDNIINLMKEYKNQYDLKCVVINKHIYYYEFSFKDSQMFNDFFKSNIFPLMGLTNSENIFSWI